MNSGESRGYIVPKFDCCGTVGLDQRGLVDLEHKSKVSGSWPRRSPKLLQCLLHRKQKSEA